MSKWAEPYMTLTFRDGGRDFPAVDCWGMVRLVLAREAGIELPTYGDIPAKALLKIARQMGSDHALPPWAPVTGERKAFDVVTMTANPGASCPRRAIVHVGILTGPDRVLHIEEGAGVQHLPLHHASIKTRIAGFYRHEALA